MKKVYIYYLLAAYINFSCSRSNTLGVLSSEHEDLTILPSTSQLESIPRPIEQTATKQLIQAIPPNEAFCVLVTPEKFKALGLNFNAFVNVVHNKNKEGLIFYYEKVAKDLLPILQHYYANNPAQIQTISVQDLFDFNELINKTTIIEGNDKKSICNRELGGLYDLKNEIGQSNDALKVGYSALDLNKIADAYEQIPYQTGCAECSVNAAARALILTGANIHSDNYSSFVANCPTIGRTVNNI